MCFEVVKCKHMQHLVAMKTAVLCISIMIIARKLGIAQTCTLHLNWMTNWRILLQPFNCFGLSRKGIRIILAFRQSFNLIFYLNGYLKWNRTFSIKANWKWFFDDSPYWWNVHNCVTKHTKHCITISLLTNCIGKTFIMQCLT